MHGLLILNADDFGMSSAINEAVVRVRSEGLLTSASLMVFAAASDEAIHISKDDPGLAVGLHLDIGPLPDPVRSGFVFHFSKAAREKAHAEITRQFEAFAETGLPLSHVDGHQHLHAHPAILPFIVQLAEQYGASGIRVPREPLLDSLKVNRARPAAQLALSLGQAYLRSACNRAMRGSSLATCDRCIGGLMTGHMSAEYIIGMLDTVPAEAVEVYLHPSVTDIEPKFGPNTGDLRTLTDPKLAEYVRSSAWELTNHAGLRAARGRGR